MINQFENLFIFEMANNHQGNVNHGLKIIKEMAKISRKHSIRAGVKLQYRELESFIHPDYVNSTALKHIPRFLSTKLSSKQLLTLVQAIKEEGLITICTPFDEPSVNLIMDHGIEIIKVASCSGNDWSLLDSISKTHKPVIASTGGLLLHQIDKLVNFFSHREVNFSLLHCVGLYPVLNENVNANFIQKLKKRYPSVIIGYSGHESPDNTDVIKIAVAKGASIFERHVGFPTDQIKLNSYSLSPDQVENWVKSAIEAQKICGNVNSKSISQDEIDSINSLKRGVYAKTFINKGEVITKSKIFFAIPCVDDQTDAFEYHESMIASTDYKSNQPIFERRGLRAKIDVIRTIIHEAKGMLNEASIILDKDVRIELSHHYGIEHFRQYGAVIVNMINRSYCKKLIIALPGQVHPNHFHKIKEETFHLLWGDLEIRINGEKTIKLRPGSNLLLEPNIPHSFSSINGAIIEEVSTTHLIGDSVYEDPEIENKDILERKTIVENW